MIYATKHYKVELGIVYTFLIVRNGLVRKMETQRELWTKVDGRNGSLVY
jgi:hypothetical protein